MKFIHLTDSHLVAPPQKLFGIDPAARLQAAIESINTYHSDAELCLVTGDLTHWGEQKAFQHFNQLMNGLKCPWTAIPGNHDVRSEMRSALPNTESDANGFIQFERSVTAGRFICLDTLDEGHPTGLLCEARLEGLRLMLGKAHYEGKDVYLFMHHAPLKIGIAALDRIRLANADAFHAVLSDFDNIRHIFFGHLHRSCHGSWHGIPFSSLKATAHQSAFLMDPDLPLTSSLELPNYAVVLAGSDSVVIHDHSYMEEDKAFTYNRGIPEGASAPPAHQKNWN